MTMNDDLKVGKETLKLDIKKKSLTVRANGQRGKSPGMAIKSLTSWVLFKKQGFFQCV